VGQLITLTFSITTTQSQHNTQYQYQYQSTISMYSRFDFLHHINRQYVPSSWKPRWFTASNDYFGLFYDKNSFLTQYTISMYNINLQYQCTVALIFVFNSTDNLPKFNRISNLHHVEHRRLTCVTLNSMVQSSIQYQFLETTMSTSRCIPRLSRESRTFFVYVINV